MTPSERAGSPHIATAVSERPRGEPGASPVFCGQHPRSTLAAGVARYSHSVGVRLAATVTTAGLLAMLTGSCLITTDPEFKVPEPGAPVLLPDTISPDPRDVIVIGATDAERLFEAQVQSEDAGAPLEVRLLFNYGQADGEQPYVDFIEGTDVPPGTQADGPRDVRARWTKGKFNMSQAGCYRFTLMVGHDFDSQGCPGRDDYDAVSWLVLQCDAINGCPTSLSDCPPSDFDCRNLPTGGGS